ncbi:MAG: ECF transporter S component [Oscillospiraceae bacterium]|jgi:energy-coupling factor transport system substrate-specific component|nr:ECF transporter S component [Oscillospiraceae bacterium]MCI1990850.1 ECF transporter S component [Oscillospiraceae bacterium]MCI2035685.1 ECF transporter S component [Oscillospiraceae bacterium]
MKRSPTVKITVTAFCTAINIVGASIALALRLPIYLDSIGTVLNSVLLGPVFGLTTACLSSIFSGITSDPYAFYFMPAGMITGLLAGFLSRSGWFRKKKFLLGVLFLTVPGTIVSSCIAAFLFGGVTSSGSSMLVQVLHRVGLSMVASTFLVQILTDYLDRILSVSIVSIASSRLGGRFRKLLSGGKSNGTL